jgi:ribosomal protein S18 acetylase RimI-like enzyme
MIVKSLQHRTDLIFHRFNAVVQDHGDHLSIETPSNPGFFWGNYLIFERPPRRGDMRLWRERFRERFSGNPLIRHEVYAWDLEANGETSFEPFVEEFLREGFRLDIGVTMASQRAIRPRKWNDRIVVRPLESDADWASALENQVSIHADEYGEGDYRDFRTKKNTVYREMARAGLGAWWGAFLDGKLVADVGLFLDGTLGRFQFMSTLPEYRRQGICGTLLYRVCEAGFHQGGLSTLVIAADDHYFAKEIYESVGFRIVERNAALELRPAEVM